MSGASPTEDVVAETGDSPSGPGRKLGNRKIAVVAAIAVLVLAGLGTAVFFLTRSDDPPAASQEDSGDGGPVAAPAGGTVTPGTPPPPPTGANAGEATSARQIAEQAIRAFNGHDPEGMKKISCDPAGIPAGDTIPPEARVELVANPELTGDTATVNLRLIIGGQATDTPLPLPLRKVNGTWCVD